MDPTPASGAPRPPANGPTLFFAVFLLPTAYGLLPTAFCQLPPAHCLLPSTYRLPSTTYYLPLFPALFHAEFLRLRLVVQWAKY